MSCCKKISQHYKACALILLNTCVFFLLLNTVLFVFFKVKDHIFGEKENIKVTRRYSNPSLQKLYPQLDEKSLYDLLIETWSRPYAYEPFTQFKERPYRGEYVNVDENGFRIGKNQGPWPPDPNSFNIFLFGGSTAFGYGVRDEQTIASYLQEILSNRLKRDVRVYNFGRGSYYSTQERVLMEKLLVSGHVPDMAIFLDGLNEFYFHGDEPYGSDVLRQLIDGAGSRSIWALLDKLPMVRAAWSLKQLANKSLRKNGDSGEQDGAKRVPLDKVTVNNESIINGVIKRYLENGKVIEAVAAAHGVRPVFVWQPVPTYKHDLDYHIFAGWGFGEHRYSKHGYRYMKELVKENHPGDNFLWCADINENAREPLYIDRVHYSAKMSKKLAATIADMLLKRNLIPPGKKT